MNAKKSQRCRAFGLASLLWVVGCGDTDHNLGDSPGSGGSAQDGGTGGATGTAGRATGAGGVATGTSQATTGAAGGTASGGAGGSPTSGTASGGAGGTPTSGTASGGASGSAGAGGAGGTKDAGSDGAIPDCPTEGCYGTTCDIARLNNCNTWRCPGLTATCPTLRFVPGDSGTNQLQNPDALTCALEKLRDGTPGVLDQTAGQGAFHSSFQLILLPNRKALTSTHITMDAFASAFTRGPNPIRPREYFANCLLDPTEKARIDCWNNAYTSCQ